MFTEFLLTDGTTTIDLLQLNKAGAGVGIDHYSPGRLQAKGGGTWQDSPLAAGRRLVFQTQGNVTDQLTLKIAYRSSAEVIRQQEQLDVLLARAMSYWTTDWQDQFVYIQAIAVGETNRRYAVVYGYQMGEYPSPYEELMTGGRGQKMFIMDNLLLGLERSTWMAYVPNSGTAISMTHSKHTIAGTKVVVGNSHTSGLAAIHSEYPSGFATAFTGNLLSGSLPYDLFYGYELSGSITVDEGDPTYRTAIYFGATYPFLGLVFDLSEPLVNATGVWEVQIEQNVWIEFSNVDDTNELTETGIRSMYWPSALYDGSEWQSTLVSSLGPYYWVRFRLTADSGTVTSAVQSTNHIYTATIPYVEIAAAQIIGNMDAIARLRLTRQSAPIVTTLTQTNQDIIVGLRSIFRAGVDCSDFTAYINPDTDDNPVGINIVLNDAKSGVASGAAIGSPTLKSITYTALAGDEIDELFRVEFESAIARQYLGRYRLFARVTAADTSGNAQLRAVVKYENAASSFAGEVITIGSNLDVYSDALIDLGYVRLPPTSLTSFDDQSETLVLIIEGVCTADEAMEFTNLILMPVDEWSAQASGSALAAFDNFIIDIDSIGYPKETLRAVLRDIDSLKVIDTFPLIANQDVHLHAGTRQRLWFMMRNLSFYQNVSTAVEITVNPRFYNLRSS